MKYKYDHIDPEIVINLIKGGTLVKDIAVIYGCTVETLKSQMKLKGYEYNARLSFTRPDISLEEVVELRNQGYKLREIAKRFNCGFSVIKNRLTQAGLIKKIEVNVDNEEIYRLYEEGLSKAEIGRRLGYSLFLANKGLMQKGVVIPKRVRKNYSLKHRTVEDSLRTMGYRPKRRPLRDIPLEEVIKLYDEEILCIKEIAEKYNCSTSTIYRRLEQRKKKLRGLKRKTLNKSPTLNKRKIRNEFKKGKSIAKLSIENETTMPTIRKIVEKLL